MSGDEGPVVRGDRRQRRGDRLRLGAASVAALVLAGVAGKLILEDQIQRLGPVPLARAEKSSTVVLDRNGVLLRAFTTAGGRWRLPVSNVDVDRRYLDLLIAFEDKRFRDHGGVDWHAMVRALAQLVVNGRVVSGASTLTMQVARLIDERQGRSLGDKWRQMLRAIQIERAFSKDKILDLYLMLAPFGGNLEGVRAASLAYFGREPQRLSLGEAALLVALPQAPEGRRPDLATNRARVRIARGRVLARAKDAGLIGAAEMARADGELLPTVRRTFAMDAPHLAESIVGENDGRTSYRLTIRRELQRKLFARGHDKAGIERVLDDLSERGLLSEERMAEVYVAERVRKGFGPVRIRQELRQRGLPGELIEPHLDKTRQEWLEVMAAAHDKKFGVTRASDARERAKRSRFLEYRGFPADLIAGFLHGDDLF